MLAESDLKILEGVLPVQELLTNFLENKTQLEVTKLNKFLSHFASHLHESKETIDFNYLATVEAQIILEKLIELGTKEDQQEKTELLLLFLTSFIDLKFSTDENKIQLFQVLEKITFLQTGILCDAAEWLVLAYSRDIVKQSTDYKPANKEQIFAGYIMESFLAVFAQKTVRDFAPQLDSMVEMGAMALANDGKEIHHFAQTGRGFKPTTLGLQLLEYLGVSLETMPEKKDFSKK